MSTNAKPYKDTLNLPVTRFDMKANLNVREPKVQARWAETDLYGRIREAGKGKERRVLHDGPPYANGDIHMGHLLNKVLKDVIVRFCTMRGYDSPYVPGWDCHGLPIEHKVMKDLGSKAATMSFPEIRDLCRVEALKWVGVQTKQFQRLGISGDFENPYLTLNPGYEAAVLDVLADLLERGDVFRQLKPLHWCIQDRTALAEAELEYRDETSTSVYVNFPMLSGVPAAWGEGPWNAMIWTTTPWSLPGNVAIALNPKVDYAGVRYVDPADGKPVHAIVAVELLPKVMALRGVAEVVELGRCKGKDLEGATYRHVFIDRVGPLIMADYVSVDDGTGLVHNAPGHGVEDYQVCRALGLPTISPVDAAGRFTDEAPAELVGKNVFAANPVVVEMLRGAGALYHEFAFKHSYPHCWRCKKPVIQRATEQWFIGVDLNDLRKKTLDVIEGVDWIPEWGKKRIGSMVAGRPDWCISRQRAWGVPIPAFGCEACETQILTADSVRHVRDIVREKGADAWYTEPVEALLPPGTACPKCGGGAFRREGDILDVWFESGSSHRAVLSDEGRGLGFPAYLYLEGSDQHRGWFQSSILTAVGTTGRAPFEAVLTHGFILDEKGEKMSKSGGNAISAVKATETYGADVLRLMIASMDYADDVKVREAGIKEMSESYRKIRNTFRYMLSNLDDYSGFDPASADPSTLREVDRWALGLLNEVIRDVTAAYERFDLYKAYQKLYEFCGIGLSSIYFDVLKDRLYAEAPGGEPRRAAQYVLDRVLRALVRLVAPIIPHTAEEIWDFLPADGDKVESVHLADWPEAAPAFDNTSFKSRWDSLFRLRELVTLAIEPMRAQKLIGGSQGAVVTLSYPTEERAAAARPDIELLTELFIVSEVRVVSSGSGGDFEFPVVLVEKSTYPKCERCWNQRASVGSDPAYPTLCGRCSGVLAQMPAGD
jgi:isoleucyl-tRNA synthetase